VHENILAAVIGLDEARAFLAVEPLYGSLRHETLLSGACLDSAARSRAADFIVIEILETKSPVRRIARGEAKSSGRNSIDRTLCMSAASTSPLSSARTVGRWLLVPFRSGRRAAYFHIGATHSQKGRSAR
jgi:hypothetical protein